MVICDVVDGELGIVDPVTEEIKTGLNQNEVACLFADHKKDVWFMKSDKKWLMFALAWGLDAKKCEKWIADGHDGVTFSRMFERNDVVVYDIERLGVELSDDLVDNLRKMMKALNDKYYDVLDVVTFVYEQRLPLKWVEFEKEDIIKKADFVWR